MEDCFVLVPLPSGDWASACFADEFTRPRDWEMTSDHVWPRSVFPEFRDEPWNLHAAHRGCQDRQGPRIRDLTDPDAARRGAAVTNGKLTYEQRSAISHSGWMSLTPAQRSTRARKAVASLTTEQLLERGRRLNAALTHEDRVTAGHKGGAAYAAKYTPEEHSERARHAVTARWSGQTPQERSAVGRALNCVRFRINRGLPCRCGQHEETT